MGLGIWPFAQHLRGWRAAGPQNRRDAALARSIKAVAVVSVAEDCKPQAFANCTQAGMIASTMSRHTKVIRLTILIRSESQRASCHESSLIFSNVSRGIQSRVTEKSATGVASCQNKPVLDCNAHYATVSFAPGLLARFER